jgi:hypothetical protein
LQDKVDMTLTKKELLAAVKLCNDSVSLLNGSTRTASNLAKLRKLRLVKVTVSCVYGTMER